MAARLVELSVQVREVLRGPLDPATAVGSDESDNEACRPVQVPCPAQSFAVPVLTQPVPAMPNEDGVAAAAVLEDVEHTPLAFCAGAFQRPPQEEVGCFFAFKLNAWFPSRCLQSFG